VARKEVEIPERTVYICDGPGCERPAGNFNATLTVKIDGRGRDFAGQFCRTAHLTRWLRELPAIIAPAGARGRPRKDAPVAPFPPVDPEKLPRSLSKHYTHPTGDKRPS